MEIKEFNIPVPWGSIAVKAWGNEANIPVLALHGVGDNAGTFDRLIPLLPDSYYYVCIDYPCHGKSTPLPPYVFIATPDIIVSVKFVVDYLNRGKYVFMGHSWGAQVATCFVQLFPESVIKIIALDAMFFNPVRTNNVIPLFRRKIETLIRVYDDTSNIQKNGCTYSEAIEACIKTRFKTIVTKEAADVLIKRNLTYLKDGSAEICFDPPIHGLNLTFSTQFTTEMLTKYPIYCPVLLVIADESKPRFKPFNEALKVLKKYSEHCVIAHLKGSHYVHLNDPETVAPIVSKFLLYEKSKL